MIIRKLRLCSADIEAFVYSKGLSIVNYTEKGGQATAENVGRICEASKKIGC